ncbi:histone deacetylase family protein [Sneathiella sp.]|jgi:acetoin utilization deacetylase AcuC-like enzyme|uniref:histone deacetylase family protein n=1 Tax=Sneathiella sp. TaxID=1964365 RepID=UPI0039E28469
MATHLFTHRDCLFHDAGPGHPEKADRLRMVLNRLEGEAFSGLVEHNASKASRKILELAHTDKYLDSIDASVPKSGIVQLDPDTFMSPGSKDAALRAVGAVCDAVDLVLTEKKTNAFCAIRPPGHHAEPDVAMGFCLYSNVAIGALYAREKFGLQKIAVVDFDVHHGNGTQAVFESEENLLYISTHQEAPFYPGTGHASEKGKGNILNIPLPSGAGSGEFKKAMTEQVFPALKAFGPELIFISAGFDAHVKDERANMNLTEADYDWVSKHLVEIAAQCCDGRLISVLEGGYDLVALADCAEIHVKALLEA